MKTKIVSFIILLSTASAHAVTYKCFGLDGGPETIELTPDYTYKRLYHTFDKKPLAISYDFKKNKTTLVFYADGNNQLFKVSAYGGKEPTKVIMYDSEASPESIDCVLDGFTLN